MRAREAECNTMDIALRIAGYQRFTEDCPHFCSGDHQSLGKNYLPKPLSNPLNPAKFA